MGDPRRLRPDEVEILVAREMRKAGVSISNPRERRRTRLSKEDDSFAMELGAIIRVEGEERRVLIECRSERALVGAAAVRALHERLAAPEEDAPRRLLGPPPSPSPAAAAPPPLRHAIMFSTSGYEPDAVREARRLGVPLLTVADGKAAFARTQMGTMAGDPPAWVPEYMSEVVDLDAAGGLRHHLVMAGRPQIILDRLTPSAPS